MPGIHIEDARAVIDCVVKLVYNVRPADIVRTVLSRYRDASQQPDPPFDAYCSEKARLLSEKGLSYFWGILDTQHQLSLTQLALDTYAEECGAVGGHCDKCARAHSQTLQTANNELAKIHDALNMVMTRYQALVERETEYQRIERCVAGGGTLDDVRRILYEKRQAPVSEPAPVRE